MEWQAMASTAAPKAALIYEFDVQYPTAPLVFHMYPGLGRAVWHQQTHTDHASPPLQSKTGWSLLPEQLQSQRSWTKDTDSGVDYSTSTSQDQYVHRSLSMYSSIPAVSYVWTEEYRSQPPSARARQFISSQTRARPFIAADSEPDVRSQEIHPQHGKKHSQTAVRRSTRIAIGRWNSEEHQWFLKGLEMFQGPAWGEIARFIGTRTSTQVRTHAQKFFAKLARLNQTIPYFEVQIQKERTRLVTQGANVALTAQSAPNAFQSTTLCPRKHLASNSPRQSLKRFNEGASSTYVAALQAQRPQLNDDSNPRAYTDSAVECSLVMPPSITIQWAQHWTPDDTRQWPLASPTSTTASLQLMQIQMGNGCLEKTSAEPDADSLPSMNKLLCHSSNL